MGAGKDNGSDILTDTVGFFGESNAAEVDDWEEHKTEEGKTFYLQHSTGLSQWEKPSGVVFR